MIKYFATSDAIISHDSSRPTVPRIGYFISTTHLGYYARRCYSYRDELRYGFDDNEAEELI